MRAHWRESLPISARPRTGFRADIEGLRAVAVLLVIAAHYVAPGFSGGFIGVDIFFVISGYLITGILVHEHETTGRIILLRFYANRLRRLLPALSFMLLLTSAAIWWWLPLGVQPAQSLAAALAEFWISNLHFAFVEADYFSAGSAGNAFLHTWSLGVEEQFYLLWPFLILLGMSLLRGKPRRLAILLAIVGTLSLVLCLAWAQSKPMLAFYMMPARAWQFAAGALAWLATRQYPPGRAQSRVVNWAGVMLLIIGLIAIGPAMLYPGWWALVPTAASVGLLWAGSATHASWVTGVLTAPPTQAIGRMSYALYLWHWPILVIGRHLLPESAGLVGSLALLSASLAAAWLTHHLVENPIRFGRPARIRYVVQIGAALSLMVLVNAQLLRWNVSARDALKSSRDSLAARAARDVPVIYRDGCDDWFRDDALKPCTYGSDKAAKMVVLLGDSIGAQWFPAIARMFDPRQWKLVVLTKSSCPMVDEPFFYQRIGREYTECAVWRERVVAWLQSHPPEYLFVGGTASSDFSQEQWIQGTRRLLDRLASSAGAVYLIEPSPALAFNGPDCLSRGEPERCRSSVVDPHRVQVAGFLRRAMEGRPKVHWLETERFICPDGQCFAMRSIAGRQVVVFRDNQHLTAGFAAMASEHFTRQLGRGGAMFVPAPTQMPRK